VSSPLLCLVTDRRRLAGRLGCGEAASTDWLLLQVRAAARAGVDYVQVREGDLPARTLVALTRRIVEAVRGTRARVVVNDRIDVAIAGEAHGVHLKSTSIAPPTARELWPDGALVGVSVHGASEVPSRVVQVDYVIAGTVAATPSKPVGWRLLGMEGLTAVVEAAAGVPVLGIGGLDLRAVPGLRRAGARGLAGIDVFLPIVPPERFEDSVHDVVASLRFAFDSPERVT
jgi:thiamine-phosphate pyrophosphorylase